MPVLDHSLSINRFFEEISAIPHGSYNEKALADYIVSFALEHNLRCYRDNTNNVVIYKDGSAGREKEPPLMLQCHIDMVCEKDRDCHHDFDRDPLKLRLDGSWLSAEGTTLGADNATGVSYILAILSDTEASHPPLECVFTSMEEVGMIGANALAEDAITARRMIGLDGGGEFGTCVSASGGIKVHVSKKVSFSENCNSCLRFTVGGLKGGHSGLMIDKGLANADKLGFRVLYGLLQLDPKIRIVSLFGGQKENGIPREFTCGISYTAGYDILEEHIKKLWGEISEEYSECDPDAYISVEKTDTAPEAVINADTQMLIKLGELLPNGVELTSLRLKIPTASVNIGACRLDGENMEYRMSIRSPYESMKTYLVEKIKLISEIFKAEVETDGDYPGWIYADNSSLLDTIKEMFKERRTDFFVGAVHGGLEAGIWKKRYPDMDIITYGPILFDCHTTQERLDMTSFARTYNNLLELLRRV